MSRPAPLKLPPDPVFPDNMRLPSLLQRLDEALYDEYVMTYPKQGQLWLSETHYFELTRERLNCRPKLTLCERVRHRVGRWIAAYDTVYEAVEAVMAMRSASCRYGFVEG